MSKIKNVSRRYKCWLLLEKNVLFVFKNYLVPRGKRNIRWLKIIKYFTFSYSLDILINPFYFSRFFPFVGNLATVTHYNLNMGGSSVDNREMQHTPPPVIFCVDRKIKPMICLYLLLTIDHSSSCIHF